MWFLTASCSLLTSDCLQQLTLWSGNRCFWYQIRQLEVVPSHHRCCEPERAREIQREPERASGSQKEPERVREKEPDRESQREANVADVQLKAEAGIVLAHI